MSVRAIKAVKEHSRSEHGARLVMVFLADAAQNDGVAWPSRETLAKDANIAAGSVSRHITELEALGELEVREYKRGRTRLNCYRLRLPGLDDVDYARLEEHGIVLTEPFTASQIVTSSGSDEVTISGSTRSRKLTSRARVKDRLNRKENRNEAGLEEGVSREGSLPREGSLARKGFESEWKRLVAEDVPDDTLSAFELHCWYGDHLRVVAGIEFDPAAETAELAAMWRRWRQEQK